jgi:uncharacterized membrane protein HdeD (DUF308 family)
MAEMHMLGLLRYNWWLIALRGVSALVLAVLIVGWPSRTLLTMILLFGVYTLVDGLLTLIAGIRGGNQSRRRWSLLLEGIMGVIAGLLTLILPGVSAQFILVLLAVWAISTGVTAIRSAVQLRHEIIGEWLLALGGGISLLFGLVLLVVGSSPVIVVFLLSSYAGVFGLVLLALALRLKWVGRTTMAVTDGTS